MVEDEAKKKSSSETRANLFLSREETLVGSIFTLAASAQYVSVRNAENFKCYFSQRNFFL